jgi:hypothetical protein
MALNETCSIQRDRETTQDSTLERLMQCLRLQDSTLDRLYTQATPNPWWERSGTPTPPTVCVQATVCPSSSTVRLPWMIRGSLNHGGAAMRVLASDARVRMCARNVLWASPIVFVTTHTIQLCLSRHTQFNCVCHTQFNCVCHDTLVTTHTPVLSRLLQHARERERDGLGRRRWHSGLACRISLSFERCRSCIEKSPQKNTRKPRPTEAYTNTRITYRFQ